MTKEITSRQAMSHPTVVATINTLAETTQRLQDEIDALKKPWVGLTDVERDAIAAATLDLHGIPKFFATAIEAKLKEKNT